jgi:L-2-hydroxyglutarate oxidase
LEPNKVYDITVVGGGIVGLAAAYKLQLKYPKLNLLLIEKEDSLASHQTGRNSGVIHSGIYYRPGSLKAKNCVDGRHQLVRFAREHNINHDVCGKVIVAADKSELLIRDKIFRNGKENNIEGIEKIDADQLRDIEPYVEGFGGIWVPCTGIIDFKATTEKFAYLVKAMQPESRIVLGEKVLSYIDQSDNTLVITSKNKYYTKHMIFCGGLFADRLAKKDNVKLREKVIGFRGDYFKLTDKAKAKVKNLIYPVPNPSFPFLGVHFTRKINGDVECGPNAVLTFKKEGYRKTDFNFKDTIDALSYSGTWNLLFNNFYFAVDEYRRAFSKNHYLETLKRLIPSLTKNDIIPGRAGVRAMLLGKDGQMIDDFRIVCQDKSIHVLNAPSPAATACLSIADEILKIAEGFLNLKS